ncbi:hypothetical protein [Pseudomonas sp. 22 E 5]|jgi:hypothetical protein|nr:hypothetical protein [Pseudomonas sp. 31 E 5]CRM20921.1 hypothetical protein [Pseudomonas sp. 31 E 6]CRM88485.1 hypothetical protein [Pseudomonas sp. 22 E 5]
MNALPQKVHTFVYKSGQPFLLFANMHNFSTLTRNALLTYSSEYCCLHLGHNRSEKVDTLYAGSASVAGS